MAALPPPSPTDAPTREGEAYSEWRDASRANVARLAAEPTVVPEVAAPARHARGAAWPLPDLPDAPIGVELVRARGTDEWRVCVDGLETPTAVPEYDAARPFVCALPPPFDPTQPMTRSTRPRVLAIAVRLEEEALRPASVELVVDQVISSDERLDQSLEARDERQELKRVALTPYSATDPTARAIATCYPYIAPAQSALGIVSFKEVERFNERRAVYDIGQRVRLRALRTLLKLYVARQRGSVAPPSVPRTFAEEQPAETTRTLVLGGLTRSAPQHIAELANAIVVRCMRVRADERSRQVEALMGFPGRLSQLRARNIRVLLIRDEQMEALYFFDALARGGPASEGPGDTNDLLKVRPLPAALQRITDASINTPRAAFLTTVRFLYSRLGLDVRMHTSTRLEPRLEIVEMDGRRRTVTLVPERPVHGAVAHAGIVGTIGELEDMRRSLAALRSCLEALEGDRPLWRQLAARFRVRRPLAEQLPESLWKWSLSPTSWLPQPEYDVRKLVRGVAELELVVSFNAVPLWPQPTGLLGALAPPTPAPAVPVTRLLPQVVLSTALYPSLQPPVDTAPPDEHVRRRKAEASWLALVTGLTTGTVVGAGAGVVTAGLSFWNSFLVNLLFGFTPGVLAGVAAGVSTGYAMHRLITDRSRRLDEGKLLIGDIARRAERKLRGTPVLSTFSNAREAVRALRMAGGLDELLRADGARFRFKQRYGWASAATVGPLPGAAPVGADDWDRAPDANAQRLLPPVEVAEALHEAVALRRVPLVPAVRRVVGAPGSDGAATTPAALAAVAAHAELLDALWSDRTVLRGEHATVSAADAALAIAQSGQALVIAAYGVAAGVTHVRGADALWRCFRHGTAARLALRHLSLFARAEEAEGRLAPPGPTAALVAADERAWLRANRELAEEFASAWVAHARTVAAAARRTEWPTYPLPGSEAAAAAQAYARVRALTTDPVAPLATIDVRVARWLSSATNPSARDAVAVAEARARRFADQAGRVPPTNRLGPHLLAIALAARRADGEALDAWRPTEPAAALIERLSALTVGASDAGGPVAAAVGGDAQARHFYFPLGSSLRDAPSATPFDEPSLGVRLVWLANVAEAAQAVATALRLVGVDALPPDAARIVHAPTDPAMRGLQRHPLVIGLLGREVRTFLARWPDAAAAGAGAAPPGDAASSSMLMALRARLEPLTADAGRALRTHTRRARALAFSAERLACALVVVHSLAPAAAGVDVPTHAGQPAETAVAVAVGLALVMGDLGERHTVPTVRMADAATRTAAVEALGRVEAAARSAIDQGCHAVKLSELALALASVA